MTDPTREPSEAEYDELEMLRERARIIRAAAPRSGPPSPLEETARCIEWGALEIERLRERIADLVGDLCAALTAAAQVRERAGGDNVTVPRQAVQFVLDNANFQDEGPPREGWKSDKMERAVAELEAAVSTAPTLMPIYGATEAPASLYWLMGAENYWVIQRAGYDVDAFDNEQDARNRLANLQDFEKKNRAEVRDFQASTEPDSGLSVLGLRKGEE